MAQRAAGAKALLECQGSDPIDRLEVEAAAGANAMFSPTVWAYGYVKEICFVDNNVNLSWLASRCFF